MLSVKTNMLAWNASRQLGMTTRKEAKSAEKLSSGYRINRAADDAAGLSISEKLRRQVRGLAKGVENAQEGISLCQVADGALNEVHDMAQRLNELCVQAANGTNTYSDRKAIQQEITQLLAEIDRVSDTTTFNEKNLFGGAGVERMLAASQPNAKPTTPTPPTAPTAPVVSGTPILVGDFTVQGGTQGTDFDFDGVVLTIKDGANVAISGTTTKNRIEVADGANANIILKGVNIDVSATGDIYTGTSGFAAFEIADDSSGNVNIFLEGENRLSSGTYCAGLQKNGKGDGIGTLTISGDGSLYADGYHDGAGIGGGRGKAGSNIIISSGTVDAESLDNSSLGGLGAGIGGGGYGSGSNIIISGGSVTAIGGLGGAGIGGGNGEAGSDIAIYDGKVEATGGTYGAGIGGGAGRKGSGSGITIYGGEVKATGGGSGAGIGGGAQGEGSDISIYGGEVTATGGGRGAGIGGGMHAVGSDITIYGGTVTATGGNGGAGIGGGWKSLTDSKHSGEGNNIAIKGGSGSATCAAGAQKIGSGENSSDGASNMVGGSPAPADAANRSGGTFTWNLPDALPTDMQFSAIPTKKWWWIHSGAEPGIGLVLEIDAMNTSVLGLSGLDVTTDQGAADGINAAKGAIAYVSNLRGKIGAQQNRLEYTIANENNIVENTQTAEAAIRDTDVAKETVESSLLNIAKQAGTSMLSQANQSNQLALSLLG